MFIISLLQLCLVLGVLGAFIYFWFLIFRLLILATKALKIYIEKNS